MNKDFYLIVDTETCNSMENPLTYNFAGSVIDRNGNTYETGSFINRDVFEGMPELMRSAYYANKKDIYISRMRKRSCIMDKFGYTTQQMYRDIKEFDVHHAFAYNSPFDVRVFDWNCDWFKCINPFEEIPVFDIRGYVHQFIVSQEYKDFCEKNRLFTESGNYSTTAEAVMQYL